MFPFGLHLQPLQSTRMRDFWLANWCSIAGFGVFLALFGGPNDWLRLLVFTVTTGLGQTQSAKHPVKSVFGFLLFTFAMYTWMYLDPSGVMNRLNIGVAMYGLVSTGSVLAIGIYLGTTGAMIGVACASLVMLTGQLPQWPMLLLQLLSGGIIGGVINKLIFDLEETRNKLEQTVMTDALTGLENRRGLPVGFEQHLAQSVRQGQPLLVTLWDINNLKRINDSEGHNAGDAYLQQFANVLKLETREGDLYYRTGGDEFVGLHLGMTDGSGLRDRIHKRFADVAVGWSVVLEDLETTLHSADLMMYETKKLQKLQRR